MLYESPHRIIDLTAQITELWPEAQLCVCSDLTKRFEKIYRGHSGEVLEALEANPNVDKGEYTVVVDLSELPPMRAEPRPDPDASAVILAHMLEGETLEDAASAARDAGCPRNEIYRAKLKIQRLFDGGD